MHNMPPKPAIDNVQEVITLGDIRSQILGKTRRFHKRRHTWLTIAANAEVIFNREKDLKIVSGQSQSGLIHHTSIVASDPKSASVHTVRVNQLKDMHVFELTIIAARSTKSY